MDDIVQRFNQLPRPQRLESKIVDNKWHFTFRHVDMEPVGDLAFLVNLPSSFIAMGEPLYNLDSLPEAESWRKRALALIRVFVTRLPGQPHRPFAWATDVAETAGKIEQALRDIGVEAPLDHVNVCGQPGNDKAMRTWEDTLRDLKIRAGRPGPQIPIGRPRVMLLSLENQDWFDDDYKGLLDQLTRKAKVQRARTSLGALRALQGNPPSTILVTDAGIAHQKDSTILNALASFVDNGGNLVIAGHFSSFISGDDLTRVFSALSLPWKRADYVRTEVEYKSPLGNSDPRAAMARKYSQKAVFLKDVDAGSAFWTYQPAQDALSQSMVFSPSSVPSSMCAAVCFSHGFGFVSYLGDVNNEQESTVLVIRMCQL